MRDSNPLEIVREIASDQDGTKPHEAYAMDRLLHAAERIEREHPYLVGTLNEPYYNRAARERGDIPVNVPCMSVFFAKGGGSVFAGGHTYDLTKEREAQAFVTAIYKLGERHGANDRRDKILDALGLTNSWSTGIGLKP